MAKASLPNCFVYAVKYLHNVSLFPNTCLIVDVLCFFVEHVMTGIKGCKMCQAGGKGGMVVPIF